MRERFTINHLRDEGVRQVMAHPIEDTLQTLGAPATKWRLDRRRAPVLGALRVFPAHHVNFTLKPDDQGW